MTLGWRLHRSKLVCFTWYDKEGNGMGNGNEIPSIAATDVLIYKYV